MAGIFAPTIGADAVGVESPTRQVGSFGGTASAFDGLESIGSAFLKEEAKKAGSGGSASEARLERESRERVAAQLDVASALMSQGREQEANNIIASAVSRHTASFDSDEGFINMVEQRTGRSFQFIVNDPAEAELLSLQSDPMFIEQAMPVARGELLKSGIDNPTNDQMLQAATNVMSRIRLQAAAVEQVKREGAAFWAAGGEDAYVGQLNNAMNSFLGILGMAQSQGAKASAQAIVTAQSQFEQVVAGLKSTIPFGVDASRFNAVVEQQKKVLNTFQNAPADFIKNANAQVMAAFTQMAQSPGEIMISQAIMESPDILSNFNFGSFIDIGKKFATFEGTFSLPIYSSPEMAVPITAPNAEETYFPAQIGGPSLSEIPPENLKGGVDRVSKMFTAIDLSTPSGPQGAAQAFTSTAAMLGSKKVRARLLPDTVRTILNPSFMKQFDKMLEVLPDQALVLKNQLALALSAQSKSWIDRARGITEGQSSPFLVNDKGKLEVDESKVKGLFGSGNLTSQVLNAVDKLYAGDLTAMIRDAGRKLDSSLLEQVYPYVRRASSELKEIDQYLNGVLWANQLVGSKLKITENDIPSTISGSSVSTDEAPKVNSLEEMRALPPNIKLFTDPEGVVRKRF